MTKKFWRDWQNRIGETEDILLSNPIVHNGECFHRYLISPNVTGNKLIKANFHGDAVDLVIECHTPVFSKNLWGFHEHIENKYLKLHREDIQTIIFKKYDK